MPETLEFISINPWHTLMSIGNLFILFLIVKKFLFKPVNNILKKRADEVEQIYVEAEDMRTKAEVDKETYESKLNNVKAETDLMIMKATEVAKHKSEEMLQEAVVEVEQRKSKAEADISLAKKKAVVEMKNDVTDMVVELAKQVVEKEIDAKTHEALIDSAIKELGEYV